MVKALTVSEFLQQLLLVTKLIHESDYPNARLVMECLYRGTPANHVYRQRIVDLQTDIQRGNWTKAWWSLQNEF